ncbi:hypothetical protein QYF36_017803 [Acer negundo]|nr:hypothetical protein QYF36_017803 [Acer negundo]
MERKVGRVPSIVFEQEDGQHGGNKLLISFQTSQIRKLVNHLGRWFFLSRLFDIEVRPEFASGDVIEKVRVLPRLVVQPLIILVVTLEFERFSKTGTQRSFHLKSFLLSQQSSDYSVENHHQIPSKS